MSWSAELMTEFQGHAEHSSAQFGQGTFGNQSWLLNCLMQRAYNTHLTSQQLTPLLSTLHF